MIIFRTAGICMVAGVLCLWSGAPGFAAEKSGPIVVNGDEVEYGTTNKEVTAKGNVVINYEGTKLTCDQLTVNTDTKECQAQGHVRIEDSKGVMLGTKLTYNFATKAGVIYDSRFKANLFYGTAAKVSKAGDREFIADDCLMTTCNFDRPHYSIHTKTAKITPGDKLQTTGVSVKVGETPLMFLPNYNHSLKDRWMRLSIMPGYNKKWGAYALYADRWVLNDYLRGRLLVDYRQKLGPAGGFDANYDTVYAGKGDLKFYYAKEHDTRLPATDKNDFDRYLVRLRHKWEIDPQTNLTSEIYRISDPKRLALGGDYNVLRDYFPREFEKDSLPLSYASLHRAFGYSSFDMTVQPRINRFYTQLEKLPELDYSLPSVKLGSSPFYMDSSSSFGNFNQVNGIPDPGTAAVDMVRFDTLDKLSLPFKLGFLHLAPFAGERLTAYDEGLDSRNISPRTVFYTGADASTKFYRIFDIKSNFMGFDIDGLRHVITPSARYTFNPSPSILSAKLKQIDGIDQIVANNSVAFELSNKLQTRRNGQTVDCADFRVDSGYIFSDRDLQTNNKQGGRLSDILFDLTLVPYSWMRFDTEATYQTNGNYFSQVYPTLSFTVGPGRSFAFGHNYEFKNGKQMSFSGSWRVNPKWKFGVYERYEFQDTADVRRGLADQQYTISRDLHCWVVDLTFGHTRSEGTIVYVLFHLKAFPAVEFNFNQTFSTPHSGAQ